MLTAHLPSGYILGRCLPARIPAVLPVALVGAVLPDLDMIWFHFVDAGTIHHHRYWVHVPLFWLAVAVVALPLTWWLGYLHTALVFFAAIGIHLVLDTLSGGILWGAPFSNELFTLVTVPATYGHWVISFLLHWTFLAEVVIWIVAILLWHRRKGRAAQ